MLAELAPRVRVESERVWVDARGLPAAELAAQLLESLASLGVEDARAGVSEVPVAAWAACSGYGARAPAGEGVSPAAGRGDDDGGTAGQRDGGSGRPRALGGPAVSGPAGDVDEPADAISPSRRPAVSPSVFLVPPGGEREYLSAFPLDVLEADAALPGMLADVGVYTCGELAALEREVVEVRFGAEGVRLWRLARSDDDRLLFLPTPPELPQASLDFLDYVVTDPERLAFTVNALLGSVCDELRERGQHARRMRLVLELAGGGHWEQGLRPGRPTGSRVAWLRLARAALERGTVGDAIAAVRIEVEAVEPAGVRQGDLFDAGFATAPAVEAAVLRLLEAQGEVVVRPEMDGHPLAERRVTWMPVPVDEVVRASAPGVAERDRGEHEKAPRAESTVPPSDFPRSRGPAIVPSDFPPPRRPAAPPSDFSPSRLAVPPSAGAHPHAGMYQGAGAGAEVPAEETAALTLQLLQQPRPVLVETVLRRDHQVPIRYRDVRAGAALESGGDGVAGPAADGRWHQVVSVAGPDRVSGGVWEEAYAREYFRATTVDGALVWLFRDARRDAWYLHGWWD